MGRITSFSKQVIVFFLVSALIIRPTFAQSLGGWSMSNPVAQGASVVYDGAKNVIINGKDYIKKGTAKITPPASAVSKVLARGVAGVALSVAVEQILGSVDWVLDAENNRIVYTPKKDPSNPDNVPKCYYNAGIGCFASASAAASAAMIEYNATASADYKATFYENFISGNTLTVYLRKEDKTTAQLYTFAYVDNPNYKPDVEEEEKKTLPLDVVAQKVISNAESGDTTAQSATTAAAADIVAEAETDSSKARPIVNQLEQSATTENADSSAQDTANEATGQTKPNTETGGTDLALEFPAFCGWAPTICEAAQTVISFPQTLTDWWNTGTSKVQEWVTSISESWTKVKEEYADKPEENTDTELEIPDLSDETVDSDISFGGSCPSPLSSNVSFMGFTKTIEFSFDPVCQIAEFIKPVVISISAFSAALIVAGVRTEDD